MNLLSTLLMIVLVCVSLADVAGYIAFGRYAYELGPRVYHGMDSALPRPAVPPGTVFETPHGLFKVVSADRMLVRERYRPLEPQQSGVRSIFDWRNGEALLDARLPSALLAVASIMLFVLFATDGFWHDIGYKVVELLALVLASAYWTRLAKTRARLLVAEYREWCAAGRPCA